jgi:DNA-binding MarR family transcriptional regulator
MKGPSAVAAIKELEWRGFVRRIDDRHDRRKVRLFLTAEGRKLYDLVMPDIDAVRKIMLADFSASEQDQLKQMLRRMRRNLSPEPARREKTANNSGRARRTAPALSP